MKNLLIAGAVGLVIVLGYAVYENAKIKRKQQVTQIISDAESSLKTLQSNPNYVERSSLYRVETEKTAQ